MEGSQQHRVEVDFRKWMVFSQTSESKEMTQRLIKMLERKRAVKGFHFRKEKQEGQGIYYLSEPNSSSELKLNDTTYEEFLTYLLTHYYKAEKKREKEPDYIPSMEPMVESGVFYSPVGEEQTFHFSENKAGFFWQLFSKISFKNKLHHSFSFSLLAFLIVQTLIIPGNFFDVHFGFAGTAVFFSVTVLVWIWNVGTYSRFIEDVRAYNDIFRLTISYFSLFFLMVMGEVNLIMLIRNEEYNSLFGLVLLLTGQLVGIILSLFLTMLMYYFKGGKLIGTK